ncbi:hypothetical protein LINPERPRIM_LOCUS5845 [Linum perenne]
MCRTHEGLPVIYCRKVALSPYRHKLDLAFLPARMPQDGIIGFANIKLSKFRYKICELSLHASRQMR